MTPRLKRKKGITDDATSKFQLKIIARDSTLIYGIFHLLSADLSVESRKPTYLGQDGEGRMGGQFKRRIEVEEEREREREARGRSAK